MSDDAVRRAIARLLDGEVENLERLSGGASRETWSFDMRHPDRSMELLILQRVASAEIPSLDMAVQARLMVAAREAGVPVPRVVAEAGTSTGTPLVITERVAGETIARRILRDDAYTRAREHLVSQCARALAALHGIDVGRVQGLDEPDQLTTWRNALDASGEPHPAFEIALRWLESHRPAQRRRTIVHGDFRLGNLIVDAHGLAALLDWELAHLGDPLEDLGWLCVKAWRFGGAQPVAGIGGYDELVSAYEEASGTTVDRDALRWWETLGTLKWGVICIMQAARHLSGAVRSVELASIGRRVCENEWDVLDCLDMPSTATGGDGAAESEDDAGLHGHPTMRELLDAVHGFLSDDVVATGGRLGFHARVAANAVAIVGRELRLRDAQESAHRTALSRLGVGSEAELAAAIRAGDFDERMPELVASVRETVRARLAVANPKHVR